MVHDIPIWFLLLGLFFPRWTLFLSWIFGGLPYHHVPFIGSLLGSIFIPRLLIAIYVFQNFGYSVWFWIYVIAQVFISFWTWTTASIRMRD